MMQQLSLPSFTYRMMAVAGKHAIFDPVRKKYVQLTPEEWVRQHVLNYLIKHLGYPTGLMQVEGKLATPRTALQRTDICVYNKAGQQVMIIECKAPTQKLSQAVITQVMRYNSQQVPFILFTNGMHHFCFSLDQEKREYFLMSAIPSFSEVVNLPFYAQ